MKAVYLILALMGTAIPYAFFVRHFSSQGFALPRFVSALFANPAAGGFTADLLVTSLVFWVFIFRQRSRGKGPSPWLFVALNLVVGVSCALPAYLYAREHGRHRQNPRP